jgi:hypothetical protein
MEGGLQSVQTLFQELKNAFLADAEVAGFPGVLMPSDCNPMGGMAADNIGGHVGESSFGMVSSIAFERVNSAQKIIRSRFLFLGDF